MNEKRKPNPDDYRVSADASDQRVDAPVLVDRPLRPANPDVPIGLIGCGGISATHCDVYRKAGYNIAAFYDRHPERAQKHRDDYFPDAVVCNSLDSFLEQPVTVVDITTHPADRVELVQKTLESGRHVLSQKPFALDLDTAKRLIEISNRNQVMLAVNQNGRWAPHVHYARQAISRGLLGKIQSVDFSIYWDHNWCAGTAFDQVRHLLLFDFGIHWFDMACCYFDGSKPKRVFSQLAKTESQKTLPALQGQVIVDFESELNQENGGEEAVAKGQASFLFRGDSTRCPLDRTVIVGSKGTLVAQGPNLNEQAVELYLDSGVARPKLETKWFNDGFDGAMSELLCAIEEKREPIHSAANNLRTLELCFAAVKSADEHVPIDVGSVTQMPGEQG